MAKTAILCLMLVLLSISAVAPGREQVAIVTTVRSDGTMSEWCPCVYTTYAQRFEGRRTASGKRFSHKARFVACRIGEFGTAVRFRYRSDNGNWHESRAIIADRGGLPLHRANRPQFDLSRKVAGELGLYRRGKDYRNGEWRIDQ